MDTDGDDYADGLDNCPNIFNPSQEDLEFDGIGSACDNCPGAYNPEQTDQDNDGFGDACNACIAFLPALEGDRPTVRFRYPLQVRASIGDYETLNTMPKSWDVTRTGRLFLSLRGKKSGSNTVNAEVYSAKKRLRNREVGESLAAPDEYITDFSSLNVDEKGRNAALNATFSLLGPGNTTLPGQERALYQLARRDLIPHTLRSEELVATASDIDPTGRWIVYASDGNPLGTNSDANNELFLLELSTGNLTQITNTFACDNGFHYDALAVLFFVYEVWSPGISLSKDAEDIVFTSNCNFEGANPGRRTQTHVYTRATGQTARLPDCLNCNALSPTISADGTLIVNYEETTTGDEEVYLALHRKMNGQFVTRRSCEPIYSGSGAISMKESLSRPSIGGKKSDRVAFIGSSATFGSIPDGDFEAYVLDIVDFNAFSAKVRQVSPGDDQLESLGVILDQKGRSLFVTRSIGGPTGETWRVSVK